MLGTSNATPATRARMTTTTNRENGVRGFNQLGRDAVVVWSSTFEDHVDDLNDQFARGCTVRSERGCFQQSPSGMIYSWLNAPVDDCGLCGGACRHR